MIPARNNRLNTPLFGAEESELWPKDYLCVPCHLKWHETINAFRKGTAA